MTNTLLILGAACILIVLAGGAGKVLGVELEVIKQAKPWRLTAIAILGIGFLVTAYLSRPVTQAPESTAVKDYRQTVMTTCSNMKSRNDGAAGVIEPDNSFNRDRLLENFHNQFVGAVAVADQLWQRPVPAELRDQAAAAKTAYDNYISFAKTEIEAARNKLPAKISYDQLQAWSSELDAEVRGPAAQFDTVMSNLGGSSCLAASNSTR